jgi:DNA-binding transcriptional MerR regulator
MAASGGGPGSTAAPPPTLTVAAVARRLGVAPSTLRTWDRRYRLGPSAHVAGSHRRYSSSDLSRLALMRRLTVEGIAPADAARMAHEMPVQAEPELAAFAPRSEHVQPSYRPVPPAQLAPRPVVLDPGPAGGGRVMAMPAGTPQARGLARAAMALDSAAMTRLLRAAVGGHGVQDTWSAMAVPVLRAIGERWNATGEGIDVEHVFSEVLIAVLRSSTDTMRAPQNAAPVLLGCAAGDQHSLPLHVLGAALAEHRIACRVMGAGVPGAALASAVRRTGPSVVFLYAQMPAADAEVLAEIPRQRPAPRVLVGGGGWETVSLPSGARRVHSLAEAVEEILLAVAP